MTADECAVVINGRFSAVGDEKTKLVFQNHFVTHQ